MVISAQKIDGPESFVIEIENSKVQGLLSEFEGDYSFMAQFLRLQDKRMVLINPVSANQTFYIPPSPFKRKLKPFVFVPFPGRNSRALSSSSSNSKSSRCRSRTRWRKAVTKITTVRAPMASHCSNSSKSSTRLKKMQHRTSSKRSTTSSSRASRTRVQMRPPLDCLRMGRSPLTRPKLARSSQMSSKSRSSSKWKEKVVRDKMLFNKRCQRQRQRLRPSMTERPLALLSSQSMRLAHSHCQPKTLNKNKLNKIIHN